MHDSTAVAIDPSAPWVIYAGTGEANGHSYSLPGMGVFKSTDAGETWTNMGLHESGHIGKVVIDPQDANVVYIAAMGPKEYLSRKAFNRLAVFSRLK